MTLEKNMTHPNFIIGALSYLLLLTGAVLLQHNVQFAIPFIIGAVILGAIHWVVSMINVCQDADLKNETESRYFWLALVIMIPPIVGMMYYSMKRKKISF